MREFASIGEAETWYAARVAGGDAEAALPLALCRGETELAERHYRETRFPNRWRANVAYLQAHRLIYLRRRDRLRTSLAESGIGLGLPEPADDPWSDLAAIARALESRIALGGASASARYLLGHAYLSMEYHEAAEAAYRDALAADPAHPVCHDNLALLVHLLDELLRQDPRNASVRAGRERIEGYLRDRDRARD